MRLVFLPLPAILMSMVCAVFSTKAAVAQAAPTVSPKPAAPPDRAALLRSALGKLPVKLDLKQQSLPDMIDALCQQAHCNVLIDDEPLLAKADLKFDGTASAALDQIADTFDYTWVASRHGGILMQKAFRNPLEHPQINLPELRRAAHDALTTMSAVAYDTFDHKQDWPLIIHDMAASFTPEQWHILNDDTVPEEKRRMTMQQMTPTQRGLLAQALYRSSFHNLLQGWQEMAAGLDNLPRVTLTMDASDTVYDLHMKEPPFRIVTMGLTYPRTGGTSGFQVHAVHVPATPASSKSSKTSGSKEVRP